MKYFLEWLESPLNQAFVMIMTLVLGFFLLIFLSAVGGC